MDINPDAASDRYPAGDCGLCFCVVRQDQKSPKPSYRLTIAERQRQRYKPPALQVVVDCSMRLNISTRRLAQP